MACRPVYIAAHLQKLSPTNVPHGEKQTQLPGDTHWMWESKLASQRLPADCHNTNGMGDAKKVQKP